MSTVYTLASTVGIGTTVPSSSHRLHVYGDTVLTSSNLGPTLTVHQTSTTTGSTLMEAYNNTTRRFAVTYGTTGYVGIGTVSTIPLYVNGYLTRNIGTYRSYTKGTSNSTTVSATALTSSTGDFASIYTTSRMIASEFDARSDARLKCNVALIPEDDMHRMLSKVTGKSYRWKGFDDGIQYGFVSQDVASAGFCNMVICVPNETSCNLTEEVEGDIIISPSNICLTLNYNEFLPFHHNALQQLLQQCGGLSTTASNVSAVAHRVAENAALIETMRARIS